MKNMKGITLVALVVTIVVLIILATISINIIFRENGIMETAKDAKDKYANAQELEEATLQETENKIDSYISNTRNTSSITGTELLEEPVFVTLSTTETNPNLTFELKQSIQDYNLILITYGIWNTYIPNGTAYQTLLLSTSQISSNSYISLQQTSHELYSWVSMIFKDSETVHIDNSRTSSNGRNFVVKSIQGIK